MTPEDLIEFEIKVDRPGANDEDLNEMAISLLEDLHETDFGQAKLTRGGPVEAGTKPGDVITWGSIAIAVLPTTIPSLFGPVQDWASRGRGGRTIKLKYEGIEYEGSREDLEKLLERIDKGKKKKK